MAWRSTCSGRFLGGGSPAETDAAAEVEPALDRGAAREDPSSRPRRRSGSIANLNAKVEMTMRHSRPEDPPGTSRRWAWHGWPNRAAAHRTTVLGGL
jgi:hypothetical protein